MTNRELLEATVLMDALTHPLPEDVTEAWFSTTTTAAAYRKIARAAQDGRELNPGDLLADPETFDLGELWLSNPYWHLEHLTTTADPERAVDALREAALSDWAKGTWTQVLRSLRDGLEPSAALRQFSADLERRLAGHGGDDWITADEAAQQVYTDLQAREAGDTARTIPYGWRSWDKLTQGLEGGQLVIVGARTAVGKTLIAGNLARYWVTHGWGVAYFALEMRARRIMARQLAAVTGLNALVLARGTLDDDAARRLAQALPSVGQWPLWIRDRPTTLSQCVQLTRQMVQQRGIRVMVVDYAGLLGNEPAYRGENTAAQVGRVAKTLKNLAMECDIPVLCLVQVNREGDDLPTLKHLRDSGDWEASADVVWLLAPDTDISLTAILAKNRDGPANVQMRMPWTPRTTLITDGQEG